MSFCVALLLVLLPVMTFFSSSTIEKYVSRSNDLVSSMDNPKCARLKMIFAVMSFSSALL
jgi:hypothetical protein